MWLEPCTPHIMKFQSVKTNRSCKTGRHHRYPRTSTVSDLLRNTLLKDFAVPHFEQCRMGKFYIQFQNVMNTIHLYHSQISGFIFRSKIRNTEQFILYLTWLKLRPTEQMQIIYPYNKFPQS